MKEQIVHNSHQLTDLFRNMRPVRDYHLGEILVEQDEISQEQLDEVLQEQRTHHGPQLGALLVEKGLVSRKQLNLALARKFNIPYLSIKDYEIDGHVLNQIPADLAMHYNVLPLAEIDGKLVVAMESPLDWEALDAIRFVTNRSAEVVIASPQDISLALNRYYTEFSEGEALEELDITPVLARNDREESKETAEAQAMKKPIVRLLNAVLLQAVKRNASDINIRPEKEGAAVFYRIDGREQFVRTLHKSLLAPLISRIKITGRMNIAERRLPQDGHARLLHEGRSIDLRISVIPTVNGESAVIRVLDKEIGLRTLEELGLRDHEIQQLRQLATQPHGMLLVTGPTGSGKSTTLYALLQEVKRGNPHIITVEDPVEYDIDGVEQIQVLPVKGYTFAEALRHILRHDPDVIMIGEIRDSETVHIANKAALTGHLVLSTLHTNDAVGSVTRLLDMGVEPFLLASTLLGAMAQRLVRLNCEHCREVEPVDSFVRGALGISEKEVFYRGKGCPTCNNTGYQGRIAVCEIVTVTAEMQHLIHRGGDEEDIRRVAREGGMTTLMQNALSLAREGRTSLEEVFSIRAPA